ncbi:unnamed protein product [Adineta ricciae]|uniref:Protein kinase domain-containing protein n=1 Tax=Adineta ricciae TaxID=249248 RepID=A0A815Y734_ADIRI|nr:unnamed protein product [Adineta ricciae]
MYTFFKDYLYQIARIPIHERWLLNRLFRIRGIFHTLTDRRGGGSFGSVWAATRADGRRVAVKVFNLNQTRNLQGLLALAKSFQDEIRMSYKMRFSTSHVVTVYGFDLDLRRRVGLVSMELGDDSLEERVRTLHMMYYSPNGRGMIDGEFIAPVDRKNIWFQIVNIALELFKHIQVHRDIKPANLVFFGPILKIVDLGIAQKEFAAYNSRQVGGTPFYSGPECIFGQFPVTPKADVWSIGAVLYFLTYGTPPAYWNSTPPPGVPLSRSLSVQEILYYTLQQNPNDRPWQYQLAQHPLTANPEVF